MTPRLVAAALASLTVASGARDAWADCTPANPFAEADRAARVVVARAAKAPAGAGAFRSALLVQQVLKGPAAPTSLTVSFNPMSGDSLSPGNRYLVFLDAQGTMAGPCATVFLDEPRAQPLPEAVRAWLAASTPKERMGVLVRVGTSGPFTAREALAPVRALEHLGNSPALLPEVDAAERAKLVAIVPSTVDDRAYGLAWVLARLHATESIPAWIGFLSKSHASANHRPVHDALEHMTNRRDAGYTPGRDFYGAELEAIRNGWARWNTQHAGKSAQDAVAVGARERSLRVPVLQDRAQLAVIVRDERDELQRRVALAACEALLRAPSSLLGNSGATGYVDWAKAAQACPVPPPPARP